ncbi:MAG: hypothetical protein ACKPKO_33080, partial [Candidatus Fonsibacter sp.]
PFRTIEEFEKQKKQAFLYALIYIENCARRHTSRPRSLVETELKSSTFCFGKQHCGVRASKAQ